MQNHHDEPESPCFGDFLDANDDLENHAIINEGENGETSSLLVKHTEHTSQATYKRKPN